MQHQATTKRKKKKNIKEQHRSKHSTFLPQQMQSPTVHLPPLDKEVCISRCSPCYSADLNDILRRVLLRYQYIAHFHVVDAFSYPLIASVFGDYECPRSNEGTSSNTHSSVSSTFSADPSWTSKFYDLLPLKKGSSKRRCAMICRALYRRIERKLNNIRQQQLFDQQRYMMGSSSSSVAEPRDDVSWMRCLTEEVEQLLLPGDCQPSPDEQIEQRNRMTQTARSDEAEDLGEDEEDERGEEYEEACAWGQFRNDVRRFAVSRMFPFLSTVSASLPLSSTTTTTTSPPPATTLSALQKGLSHKKRYELDCFAPQLHRWVQQAAAAATTTTPLSPSSSRLTTKVPSASSSSTVARPPPGRVVLVDIGAGQGYLSAKMVRDYGYTVIAVERDDTQVHGSIRRSGVLQLLELEEHEEEKEKDTAPKAMTTTDRNERRRRHDDVSRTGKRMRREDDDDDKINDDEDDVDRTTTAVPNTTSTSASTTTDDESSATTVGTNTTEMRGGRRAVKTTTTTTTRRAAGRGKLIVCQADISASTTVESFETALLAALHCSDQRSSSSSSMIDPPAVSFVLFSLHACGSLSHNMLRLFSEWRAREKTSLSSSWKSRCLLCCNVGCCYNLIAQPLSWRRRVNQGGGCEEGVKWEGAVATGSRSKEEGGAAAADAAACGCNGLSVQVEEEPRDGAPLSALAKKFMATHGAAEYEGRSWDLGGSDVPCHVVEAAKPTSPFHLSAAATICCLPQEEVPESDKGMEPTAQRTSLPLRLTRNMLMAALQAPTHWCSRRWTTDPYFTEKEEKEEEEGVRLLKDTIDSLFFRSALQLGFHQILHVEDLSRIGRVPSSKKGPLPPPTSKAASSQRHPAALPDTTKNGDSSTTTTSRPSEATMIPQQTQETRRDHKRQSEEEEKREFVEYALANFQRVQRRLVVVVEERGTTVTTTDAVSVQAKDDAQPFRTNTIHSATGTVKVHMKKSKQLLAESEKNTSRNQPDKQQQQQQQQRPLDNTTTTTTTTTTAAAVNDKVDAWTRQLEALYDQLRPPMTTTDGRAGEVAKNTVEYFSPSPLPPAGLARSGRSDWDRRSATTTLTTKGDAKLQLAVVWVVKSLVGHMLESMVVLDRAVYLQEQLQQQQQQSQSHGEQQVQQESQREKPVPHCHEGFRKDDDAMVAELDDDQDDDDGDVMTMRDEQIRIVPLFDLSESPRNLAVVAW